MRVGTSRNLQQATQRFPGARKQEILAGTPIGKSTTNYLKSKTGSSHKMGSTRELMLLREFKHSQMHAWILVACKRKEVNLSCLLCL